MCVVVVTIDQYKAAESDLHTHMHRCVDVGCRCVHVTALHGHRLMHARLRALLKNCNTQRPSERRSHKASSQ